MASNDAAVGKASAWLVRIKIERPVYAKATKIVDHGHASQHLRAALVAYYGDRDRRGKKYVDRATEMAKNACNIPMRCLGATGQPLGVSLT